MKTNFLSLLFFCGACVSAFGQELQSPQISQNAIFANPGLAGSKGQTRVCTSISAFYSNYPSRRTWDNNGYLSQTITKRAIYNGLISIDGLIMKNRLGIAGYLKNESHQINDRYNFYQNSIQYDTKYIKYLYANFNIGFMLSPKFHLTAQKTNKQDHVLSPAIAVGFKGNQFTYSGPSFYNSTTQDSIINGNKKNTFGLDYVSLGLLYSAPNSYSGIKLNFKNYINTFLLYNVSFVYAKTYFNKTVKDPKFSFTHQFQLTIPTYQFFRVNGYYSYFDNMNAQHLDNYFNANLDFRYGKFIFGTFIGVNGYAGTYAGLTCGVQLKNTKIIANYSPKLSKTYGSTGLFISANFLLQPKNKSYR